MLHPTSPTQCQLAALEPWAASGPNCKQLGWGHAHVQGKGQPGAVWAGQAPPSTPELHPESSRLYHQSKHDLDPWAQSLGHTLSLFTSTPWGQWC